MERLPRLSRVPVIFLSAYGRDQIIAQALERAIAEGRRPGRPPALTPEQVQECRRMYADTPSIRRVARIMTR